MPIWKQHPLHIHRTDLKGTGKAHAQVGQTLSKHPAASAIYRHRLLCSSCSWLHRSVNRCHLLHSSRQQLHELSLTFGWPLKARLDIHDNEYSPAAGPGLLNIRKWSHSHTWMLIASSAFQHMWAPSLAARFFFARHRRLCSEITLGGWC